MRCKMYLSLRIMIVIASDPSSQPSIPSSYNRHEKYQKLNEQ